MNPETRHRPKWQIDQVLDSLIGENVRVAAESFAPTRWNSEFPTAFISTRELVLPDNTRADGLPLYFEGRLRRYVRQIAVVYVDLDPLAATAESAEGVICFRRAMAVILRGPAVVKLAVPFRVEKIPSETVNYWEDLQMSRAQFRLPLP